MKMYCVSYRNSNIFQYVTEYANNGNCIRYQDVPILFDKEMANKVAKDVLRHMSNFNDVVVKIHEVNIDGGVEVKEEFMFVDLNVGEVFDFTDIRCRSVKIDSESYTCIDENPSMKHWKYTKFYVPPKYVKRVKN